MSKAKIFISSTCYDLADLRWELRGHLEAKAFIAILSDDPYSAFYVDPTDDSISSCLLNVETSDAVVCIVDRRYGGILKEGEFSGISATHAEVRHAWRHKKPVFMFVRRAAWDEFHQLRNDPSYQTIWIEPDSEGKRDRWLAFMTELCEHQPEEERSNWRDLFEFSTDIKPLVVKRLLDYFPQHRGTLAMQPDRIVRIHFVFGNSAGDGSVWGHFRNVGVGPALNVWHGWSIRDDGEQVLTRGALGEKENIAAADERNWRYDIPPNKAPVLFCEYDNRFGDRYRVEVPLVWGEKGYESVSGDKFIAVG